MHVDFVVVVVLMRFNATYVNLYINVMAFRLLMMEGMTISIHCLKTFMTLQLHHTFTASSSHHCPIGAF
jgi:hypothetical protein